MSSNTTKIQPDMSATPRIQPSSSGPQFKVHYVAPGFTLPIPDSIDDLCQDPKNIIFEGACTIVKISPDVVVKFGADINVTEAKTMMYVARNTNIPVPTLLACYTYGPIDCDPNGCMGHYDTYIFMSFIEGETLHDVWTSYDASTKQRIAAQLAVCMQDLRDIGEEYYIGSLGGGPVLDWKLLELKDKGPFDSEESFDMALSRTLKERAPEHHNGTSGCELLPLGHRIFFSHGDFRPVNIMVKDGNVVAIIDWGLSGWYPEYWEFATAFLWGRQTDWSDYLMQILPPYHGEYLKYRSLMMKLGWL